MTHFEIRKLQKKIDVFNEKYFRTNQDIQLIARIRGNDIFIDKSENGVVKFYNRLKFSESQNRWDIHFFNFQENCFKNINPDSQGIKLIDGSLDGALGFCEYAYRNNLDFPELSAAHSNHYKQLKKKEVKEP